VACFQNAEAVEDSPPDLKDDPLLLLAVERSGVTDGTMGRDAENAVFSSNGLLYPLRTDCPSGLFKVCLGGAFLLSPV